MMLLLVILLMLFPASSHGMQMVGFGAAGDCGSQSYDVEFATYNTYSTVYDDQERGQSWQSGVTGDMYSFSLERATAGTASEISYRVGTSADLSSSYLVAGTCTVPAAAGYFECVIPGTRPSLSSGTTYHMLFRNSIGSGAWDVRRDSAGGYANGTAYYDAAAKDWIGTTSSSDLPFKTRMCD